MARGHSGKAWLYLRVVAVLGWMLVPLTTGVAQVDWGLLEGGAGAPVPEVEQIAPVAPQPARPPSMPVAPAIAAPQLPPAVPAQPAAVKQAAAPQAPVAYKPQPPSPRLAAARKSRNAAALKLRPGFNTYTRPKRSELAREFPMEDDLDITGILSPRPFVAAEPDTAFQVAAIFPPLEAVPLPPIEEPELPEEDIPVPPLEIESVTVEEEPAPVIEPAPIEAASIPIEDLEPLIIQESPPPDDQPIMIEVMPPQGFEEETPLVIDNVAPPSEAALIESQPFAETAAPAR